MYQDDHFKIILKYFFKIFNSKIIFLIFNSKIIFLIFNSKIIFQRSSYFRDSKITIYFESEITRCKYDIVDRPREVVFNNSSMRVLLCRGHNPSFKSVLPRVYRKLSPRPRASRYALDACERSYACERLYISPGAGGGYPEREDAQFNEEG